MEDTLHLSIDANLLSDRFRSEMAGFYISTYKKILRNIVCGKVAFVDETPVNLRDGSGYVWILANMEERYYFFTETREMGYVRKLLKSFHGVLVSDFFAGYHSVPCAQQKCLIHLIRDLNNAFFRNQLDVEFKEFIQSVTALLRNIIDTIDKWGLKKWHLNKHRKEVKRFFAAISRNEYSSDLAKGFQKRFLKNENVLFTFLEHDGVPWNNNNAENAIKAFAEFRKRIGASFSKMSLGQFLVLLSVSETCKANGVNFLRFLLSRQRDLDNFRVAKQSSYSYGGSL
jgi:hypothetical protein